MFYKTYNIVTFRYNIIKMNSWWVSTKHINFAKVLYKLNLKGTKTFLFSMSDLKMITGSHMYLRCFLSIIERIVTKYTINRKQTSNW